MLQPNELRIGNVVYCGDGHEGFVPKKITWRDIECAEEVKNQQVISK
jgi:hypothetical protein